MASENPPSAVLAVQLELAAALSACADPSNPLNARLRESLELEIGTLAASLGIPASPVVMISAANGASNGVPMRLSVSDVRVRYPDELLQGVYSYVVDRPLDPLTSPDKIAAWLADRCGVNAHAEVGLAVEFLSLACLEILKREPATLFGLEQARAYLSLLPPAGPNRSAPTSALDLRSMKEILGQVLSLGISILDRQTVAAVLANALADGRSPASIREDLVEALRPHAIEIQAPRTFLQELTSSDDGEARGIFRFVREGLFEELGIELPAFRFVAVDTLKARNFRFKVNHVASLPHRGLAPNQLLVNDTAERLALSKIQAVPALHPATGQPCSLIDSSASAEARNLGLTTWTQLQHVALCLAERLRRDGHAVIHRTWVQGQLQRLNVVLGTLLATVRARWSDDQITGVLRELVKEAASIRNLRAILKLLVELGRARNEPADPANAWRSHALEPLAFVRIGLGREIAYQAGRQTNTVVVYLLDLSIERQVGSLMDAPAERADGILRAFRAEFAHLPPTAQRPHILTAVETRRPLQQLVRSEFPRLMVLAHEELPPGTNVQPIARILMQ